MYQINTDFNVGKGTAKQPLIPYEGSITGTHSPFRKQFGNLYQ